MKERGEKREGKGKGKERANLRSLLWRERWRSEGLVRCRESSSICGWFGRSAITIKKQISAGDHKHIERQIKRFGGRTLMASLADLTASQGAGRSRNTTYKSHGQEYQPQKDDFMEVEKKKWQTSINLSFQVEPVLADVSMTQLDERVHAMLFEFDPTKPRQGNRSSEGKMLVSSGTEQASFVSSQEGCRGCIDWLGFFGSSLMELERMKLAARRDRSSDGVRERTRAGALQQQQQRRKILMSWLEDSSGERDGVEASVCTSFDDGRSGSDAELGQDVGDIGDVEDLGSVGEGERPELGCWSEKLMEEKRERPGQSSRRGGEKGEEREGRT
jgi:hypothetical protein